MDIVLSGGTDDDNQVMMTMMVMHFESGEYRGVSYCNGEVSWR